MIGIFDKLRANVWSVVAVGAIATAGVQTVRIEGAFCRDVKLGEKPACIVRGFKQEIASVRIDLEAVRRTRDAERARADEEARKLKATEAAYRDAQAEAERLEVARLARVAAQQKEITHDVVQDYQRRLAAARAAAQRLRNAGAAAGAGAVGAGADFAMSTVPDAAGGTDGAAADRGLSLDERFEATANTAKVIGLQSWIRQQQRVDPN